jgi:transcriptional regulator with XRE-family HTH domain
MTSQTAAPPVGLLLKDWRQRRRLSQLDLSLEADVSARHLSFVETGRSRPSRDLLLHLAERLDVPLRERNSLLLAAGYAPLYRETPLHSTEMRPVRDALDKVLAGHEPFPAVVVDRRWNLLAANKPALRIIAEGVDPELLQQPVNALRVSLHPRGLAPRISNLPEYSAHLIDRLRRQLLVAPDDAGQSLLDELRGYPGVHTGAPSDPAAVFVPLALSTRAGELRFFSTIATFGTALDITLAELAIESFFPANEQTAARLRDSWDPAG